VLFAQARPGGFASNVPYLLRLLRFENMVTGTALYGTWHLDFHSARSAYRKVQYLLYPKENIC
jgi:hypothetical protein